MPLRKEDGKLYLALLILEDGKYSVFVLLSNTSAQPRVVPISISRLMSARTELHTQEMKNRKKREADRRHRQNKKIAVQETENKLAMTIIENESLKRAVEELRQEIFHLTSQRELTEQRIAVQETENKLAITIIENESLKRAVEELRQEIIHRTSQRELTEQRIAVQETENKLAMTIIENESLKRAVEELRQEIFHLTRRQRELTEQRVETIYTELEKEIECVCAAAEGFGEQRGMTPGTGNSQQPFHAVNQFSI